MTGNGGIENDPEYDFVLKLAEQYGIKIRVHPLGEGVRGYKLEDKDDEIILNEYNPPERRNWTFCHELAHIILGHPSLPSDEEEREADRLAAELMLPQRDFIPDSKGLELDKLKELYPHASYEVIARRCLQFNMGVLTIFDHQQVTSRLGSEGMNYPPSPAAEELQMMERCYSEKKKNSLISENLNITGYYIDRNKDIPRVVLITQPYSDFV